MEIPMNRERKLMLLRWLKQGYIDSMELSRMQKESPITDDEIETELDRLAKCMHDEECKRLQRLGFCKLRKQGGRL